MKELYNIKKLENKIKSLIYGDDKSSKDLIIIRHEPNEPKSPKKKKKKTKGK